MGALREFVIGDGFFMAMVVWSIKDKTGYSNQILANPKHIHVVKHGDQWAWRRDGSERVSGLAPTQGGAIDRARPVSKREGGELFIHRPDGRIRDRDSHGNDPRSSPG